MIARSHIAAAQLAIATAIAIAGCGSRTRGAEGHDVPLIEVPIAPTPVLREPLPAKLPAAPGEFAPSLVAINRGSAGDLTDGELLSDVDTCGSCHPDVAAQWNASAHSFASFGNPIYRVNVEQLRADLGKKASQHCGGCHDLPLLVDGLMTADAPIPPDDLRAHSGVTCRLCHGVQDVTNDGNGSYAWSAQRVASPGSAGARSGAQRRGDVIDAPTLGDAASIARHKQQVTTRVDTELCVGCHRGFLSPDLGLPVHLTGVDETGMWRGSAYTGNGTARIDKVAKATCIDCHMERTRASDKELGAKDGAVASHRFVGGHTWMASMRGDREQLKLTQAKLAGVASIDVAGARVAGQWHLPADGAPVVSGTRLELDVVIRNLLAGHRFPGGVLDLQDSWIEVEVRDARGKSLASSGLAHATDPKDQGSHVLRTLVVDDSGRVIDDHQISEFRTQVVTNTLAPREAQAVRYAFTVPQLAADQLPLAVTARLRHRSRTLVMQAAACATAATDAGRAFLAGARGAREVDLDPCKPQPITLVAETRIELGQGAKVSTARPAWERMYEHGMSLVASLVTRVGEARVVLEAALAKAPDPRARAMIEAQLGWVAAKQNRVDDAVGHVARARSLIVALGAPEPPVLDAILADAYVRANRWTEAIAPAKSCTERAPDNAAVWGVYARVLVAAGDHKTALAAAIRGLELSPRDPDLLRSQATSLAALKDPRAAAAQAAYVRFRPPDEAAGLRIRCARGNDRCARDRNPVHTIDLTPAGNSKSH